MVPQPPARSYDRSQLSVRVLIQINVGNPRTPIKCIMNITEALLGEHAVIYTLLTHLEQTTPTMTLHDIKTQAAMLTAALASHAKIEEELLFVHLEEIIGPAGPLTVMRAEHDRIEGGLEQLPKVEDLAEARRLLEEILVTARNHFAKEENVLFPMAKNALSDEVLTGLGEQWARERNVALA